MAVQIPLVVALWEHTDHTGHKRLIVEDASDLSLQAFNDRTSAIGIHPGPDYDSFKKSHGGKEPTVGFFQHVNFGGARLILSVGSYSNIHNLFNFGDLQCFIYISVDHF